MPVSSRRLFHISLWHIQNQSWRFLIPASLLHSLDHRLLSFPGVFNTSKNYNSNGVYSSTENFGIWFLNSGRNPYPCANRRKSDAEQILKSSSICLIPFASLVDDSIIIHSRTERVLSVFPLLFPSMLLKSFIILQAVVSPSPISPAKAQNSLPVYLRLPYSNGPLCCFRPCKRRAVFCDQFDGFQGEFHFYNSAYVSSISPSVGNFDAIS